MRRRLLAAGVAAVLLGGSAAPAIVAARDAQLERKLERADAKTAKLFADDAAVAEKNGLFLEAALDYRLALGFDPDHKAARKALGYSGRAGKWRAGPRTLPDENTAGEDASEAYASRRVARGQKAAREYADIAKWANGRDLGGAAAAAWSRVLSLDPDHRGARKALGFVPLVSGGDGGWVLEADGARLEAASTGEELGAGPLAKRTGLSLRRRRGPTVTVEGAASQRELGEAIRFGEAGHDLFLELFGPAEPSALKVGLLADAGEFESFLEACRPDEGADVRKTNLEEFSCIWSAVDDHYGITAWEQSDREDGVLGHLVAQHLEEWNAAAVAYPWIGEGLVAWFTVRLHATAVYYSVGEESIDPELERISGPAGWPLRARMLVRTGEAPSLAAFVAMNELNTFSADDLALAWALIRFLMERSSERFVVLVRSLGEGVDPVAALEEAAGAPVAELEAAWHRWVLERF